MRIAVVSDIHGNLPALQAVVADFTRRGGIDQVINLGDSLSGPLLPQETAQYLMAQPDWVHLAGNHERQVLTLDAHSGPSDTYAHAQLAAPELEWIAGLPHSRPWGEDVWLCHGTPDARYAIVERCDGDWSASLISVPYAHHAMVQLATLRGRPDWECALLTGYIA